MRIAIGGDHHGVAYKAELILVLEREEHLVLDVGSNSREPVDYPDYARAVGTAVRDRRADLGVLICGSGAGVAIAANKIRGVRAATCHDLFTARQAREDDDANVICLGARVVDVDFAITLTRTFLGAHFSGAERHRRRLQKVLALERAESGDTDEAVADAALAHLESTEVGKRLWAEDTTLWSADPMVRA